MLMANDVKLLGSLQGPDHLGLYGKRGKSSLADALGRMQTNSNASAMASGRPQGQYIGQQLDQASVMGGRRIDDSLAGILGAASLKESQNLTDYQRSESLAREIGDQLSPTLAQEVLGGLGAGARLATTGKGIYDAFGRKNQAYSDDPFYGAAQNPYGYDLTNIQGYKLQPNELNRYGRGY